MISKDYFDVPTKEKERKDFEKWYAEKCKSNYVFRNEIYYYCRVDVDILRQGCVIFSKLIREITGVVPFYDRTCITIASLALKIYRLNFLKKNDHRSDTGERL